MANNSAFRARTFNGPWVNYKANGVVSSLELFFQGLRVVIATSLLLLALEDVSATSSNSIRRNWHQLRTNEIRRLLVGKRLRYDVPRAASEGLDAIFTPYSEVFRRDGTVIITNHQAGLRGKYLIRSGRLCVTLPGEQTGCRHFYIDANGFLFQHTVSGFPAGVAPITVE